MDAFCVLTDFKAELYNATTILASYIGGSRTAVA